MTSLAETQRLLSRLVRSPDGVATALAALAAELPAGGLAAVVRGDERLSAAERVGIYAGMYVTRIVEVLEEDFPAVLATVGKERFREAAEAYLAEHPSTSFTLRFVGAAAAEFLAGHPLAEAWPWVPDLARLEWAVIEAFDAPDAAAIGIDALAAVPPDRWGALRFRLTPSLRVLPVGWPVDVVRSASFEGRELPAIEPRVLSLRVWRQELDVFQKQLSPEETVALEAARGGEDFAAVCERVASVSGPEGAAEAALRVLSVWFADGLVTGLDGAGA